jgi:hypothetical protein
MAFTNTDDPTDIWASIKEEANEDHRVHIEFIESTYSVEAIFELLLTEYNSRNKKRDFHSDKKQKKKRDAVESEADDDVEFEQIDKGNHNMVVDEDESSTVIIEVDLPTYNRLAEIHKRQHEDDYKPGSKTVSNDPDMFYIVFQWKQNTVKIGVTRMSKKELARRYHPYFNTYEDDIRFFRIDPSVTRERLEILFKLLVRRITTIYIYIYSICIHFSLDSFMIIECGQRTRAARSTCIGQVLLRKSRLMHI